VSMSVVSMARRYFRDGARRVGWDAHLVRRSRWVDAPMDAGRAELAST
jgi:hypothetical protein